MKKISLCGLIVGFCLVGSSFAGSGLTALTRFNQLSAQNVALDFAGRVPCTQAENIFRPWGVRIQSDGGFKPVVDEVFFLGTGFTFLRNSPCDDQGQGDDVTPQLIFDFKYPVTDVGFRFNGQGFTVSLTAYDSAGRALGSVESEELGTRTFFGAGAGQGSAISKLVVDYPDGTEEQVLGLAFSYAVRPDFVTVIPQVGDADLDALAGDAALRTVIVVTNLSNSTAQGQVAMFNPQGDGLALGLASTGGAPAGEDASIVDLNIPGGGAAVLSSSGTSESVMQGYAVITARVPIQATAVFQITDAAGAPSLEAGIAGAQPAQYQVATVSRNAADAVDSGIALANSGDTEAELELSLVRTSGVLFDRVERTLGPGEQTAAFLPQLFPAAPANFQGSLIITSTSPVSATVIRTINGLVSASLQVAQ